MSRRWSIFARLASAVGRWGRGWRSLVSAAVLLAVGSLAVAAGRGISVSTPLLRAAPTLTATPTLEPTATPTATLEPTATPTPTPIPAATPTPTPIPTATPIPTHLSVVETRDYCSGPGSHGWPALLLTSLDPASLAGSYWFRAWIRDYNADGTVYMLYQEDVVPGRTNIVNFWYEPLSMGKLPITITTEWFQGDVHPESPGHWEGTILPC
jgi:hypothetical protein